MKIARKYWLKKLKANSTPHVGFTSWEDVKSVGIVMPNRERGDVNDVHQFVKTMDSLGVETHLLLLAESKMTKKKEETREKYALYSNESNWKGIPTSEELNRFKSRKYDVVLHLCKTVEGHAEYLPYQLTTKLLVGHWKYPDQSIVDIGIEMEGRSMKSILDDAVNWLKKIKNVA
ncbi:MAG: hypothetical protein HWD92_00790 [Flavobacteriia bacterium]|nr:hypothetical protein [Flavobacteriia bacterium]